MNRILYILVFLLSFSSLQAQSDETRSIMAYIQKAMNFNKVEPQEKVYLHFDNMGYFENEKLWFKAYVTRTDCGKPSDLSKVLYVELLNPSGDVLQTQKYPIDAEGHANGEMALDTILGSGFYEVRAYTRYMTNWGTNAVFSRVFPVFKRPEEEGDYSDLNIWKGMRSQRNPNNRSREDSLYLRAIESGIDFFNPERTVSARFYPEGGDMIVGKKCRVAMLAVDDNGYPFPGEGFLTNSRGDVITTVETDTLGRGLFELTPDTCAYTLQMRNWMEMPDEELVEVLSKKSKKKKKDKKRVQIGPVQYFSLPKAMEEGCALKVDAVSDDMLATLQCSDSVCGHMLGYVVMHNGNILQADTVKAAPLIEIEMDRETLAEGVNQLTVFDGDGRIMTERLFFICPKPSVEDSIRVSTSTEYLKPCGEVEIELQTKPNVDLSFSAMDAHTLTNGKQGNMKTWMLLSSEVRGYIPNVDYYFESDDREHRESADLLMLTQGWRRYDWRLMSEKYVFRKTQPIEDRFLIFGQLKEYTKRNTVDNVYLQAILYNRAGQSMSGWTKTDSLGRYSFNMPFVDGDWNMVFFTHKKKGGKYAKKKTYYVGVSRQFSPEPRFITSEETSIGRPLEPNLFVIDPDKIVPFADRFVPITNKNIMLRNVTVSARQNPVTRIGRWSVTNEDWARRRAVTFYNIDREVNKFMDDGGGTVESIFEYLAKRNSFFNNPECKNLPQDCGDYWTGAMAYDHHKVHWVVANGSTLNGFGGSVTTDETSSTGGGVKNEMTNLVFPYWIDDIRSAYVCPSGDGCTIYLYVHDFINIAKNKGIRRTYFQGFNVPETFKTEDYSVIPPMADFRRTLWWQPDVKTDENGKATIKFYNNSTCEEMYISVEGMDENGKVLINE